MFGVTDIGDAEIILLGPEEGDVIKCLATSQHIARGRLTLALRHHEMLDAEPVAAQRIRPTRNIARREYSGRAGFEKLVHKDAVFDRQSGLLGQDRGRSNADADNDEVGLYSFAAVGNYVLYLAA